MSDSEDVQRRSATPEQGGDRRRLLFIGYPDPFLVTRLPLEAVVANGAVRLNDGKTVLGFAHHPLPEGTRVRVGYREWLYAELIDGSEAETGADAGKVVSRVDAGQVAESVPLVEPESPEAPEAEFAVVAEREPADAADPDPASEPEVEPAVAAAEEPGSESEGDGLDVERQGVEPRAVERLAVERLEGWRQETALREVERQEAERREGQASSFGSRKAGLRDGQLSPVEPEPATEPAGTHGEAGPSAQLPEAEQADMFPDDLTTSGGEHAPISQDSERESWTDAFRRRHDPEREP
jgi:hypothetical protein